MNKRLWESAKAQGSSHYKEGKETIDTILERGQFPNYALGNITKYLERVLFQLNHIRFDVKQTPEIEKVVRDVGKALHYNEFLNAYIQPEDK